MGQVLHAVIGTAGHIDHGKSSLVKALTGTDPDRFPEEQARGMTIDLGFAEYRTKEGIDVGLIDVPGHEKFVRNMVAGATGIDIVMLVVAADDGVMPQTREHLEILGLLGQRRGFVVLSKVDMVDKDLADLVEEEIRDFVKGTFLEGTPILRCSSITGQGLDEVRALIDELARTLPPRDVLGVFRLPIQRSFTVKGHGTIVTGVPVTGRVEIGQELEVLPQGMRCRVRGIQVHHAACESAEAGHRTALNLTDVNYRDLKRGHVVAQPGFFTASRLVEARFRLLRSWKSSLRDGMPIRFHSGCLETLGTISLLDVKRLEPGEECFIQLRLEEPVVVAPGDAYLVRLASPEKTIGGGIVLGETRFRFKRFRDWIKENLQGKEASLQDRQRYLEYVVRSEGLHPVEVDRLPSLVKDSWAGVTENLLALRRSGKLVELGGSREVVHADMIGRALQEVEKALLHLHEADHYPFGFGPTAVTSRVKFAPALVELALERGVKEQKLELQNGQYRLKAFKGSVSNEDRRLLGVIEDRMRLGKFATPIPADLAEETGRPKKRIENVLTLLEGWGRVIKLDENVYLHMESIRYARDQLVQYCLTHGEIPSSTMKDVIGATRKYVIPLLEYFDKVGLTTRHDSSRKLKPGYESVLAPPP